MYIFSRSRSNVSTLWWFYCDSCFEAQSLSCVTNLPPGYYQRFLNVSLCRSLSLSALSQRRDLIHLLAIPPRSYASHFNNFWKVSNGSSLFVVIGNKMWLKSAAWETRDSLVLFSLMSVAEYKKARHQGSILSASRHGKRPLCCYYLSKFFGLVAMLQIPKQGRFVSADRYIMRTRMAHPVSLHDVGVQ